MSLTSGKRDSLRTSSPELTWNRQMTVKMKTFKKCKRVFVAIFLWLFKGLHYLISIDTIS